MNRIGNLSGSRRGFTLLELSVVLALAVLTLSVLLPAARGQWDRMAVLGAREEVVGLLHRARQAAIARGGAELLLRADPPHADLLAGSDTVGVARLGDRYGVALTLSGGRPEALLAFGPLGLGRVASQTLSFRRGEAETRLVVSSLGRVARR